MKVNAEQELTLQKNEQIVCKFLECLKIDLTFVQSEN